MPHHTYDFFEKCALVAGMTPDQARQIAQGSYEAAARINALPDHDLRNLWREIDALGGYVRPGDQKGNGYVEALDDVMEILERHGFAEGIAPALGGGLSHVGPHRPLQGRSTVSLNPARARRNVAPHGRGRQRCDG